MDPGDFPFFWKGPFYPEDESESIPELAGLTMPPSNIGDPVFYTVPTTLDIHGHFNQFESSRISSSTASTSVPTVFSNDLSNETRSSSVTAEMTHDKAEVPWSALDWSALNLHVGMTGLDTVCFIPISNS
jgi:hypothetical protein